MTDGLTIRDENSTREILSNVPVFLTGICLLINIFWSVILNYGYLCTHLKMKNYKKKVLNKYKKHIFRDFSFNVYTLIFCFLHICRKNNKILNLSTLFSTLLLMKSLYLALLVYSIKWTWIQMHIPIHWWESRIFEKGEILSFKKQ